jgi:hypothetical protein
MEKKRNKKRLRAQKDNSSEMKMSALIINYASDYIRLGDNLEEKQSYLNAACAAWNIALLKQAKRQKALDNFIEQYIKINPGVDDMDDVRHDMELLVKEKIRLYPNVKRVIAEAKIVNEKGQERILVASTGPSIQ